MTDLSAAAVRRKVSRAFGNPPPQSPQLVDGVITAISNDRLEVEIGGAKIIVTRAVGTQFSTDRVIGLAVVGAVVRLSRVGRVYAVHGTLQGF